MAIAKDLRAAQAMSVQDADALFGRLAVLTASLKRESAATERRKAEIDLKAAEAVAPIKREYDTVFAALTDYITTHPERFVRPRKHKVGELGTYGIETAPDKVDKILIETVAEYADKQGLALYKTDRTPDKTAIAQAFRDGLSVPGVRYTPPGDVPKIKVAPGYIEQQLKG